MECEARDEQVERPDSVARLLQRVPHLGRAPGFGIAKLPHGNHGEEFGDFCPLALRLRAALQPVIQLYNSRAVIEDTAQSPGWSRSIRARTGTFRRMSAMQVFVSSRTFTRQNSTPAGIAPCGGRAKAGSSIAMRSKNPGGQESGAASPHGFNSR